MLLHYVFSIERDGIHIYHFALTVGQWVNLNSKLTCLFLQYNQQDASVIPNHLFL